LEQIIAKTVEFVVKHFICDLCFFQALYSGSCM